ncbi:MAG: hypothetical protein JXD21_08440 [Candidatus Omnitrophica bacterium]|nr:hypothetical protein [Candidatus Omnitrophota bacterium]
MKKIFVFIFCLLFAVPCAYSREELIMMGTKGQVKAFLSYGYGDRGAGYSEYYFRLSLTNNSNRAIRLDAAGDRYYFKTNEGRVYMAEIDREKCPQFINPDDFGEIPLTDRGVATVYRWLSEIKFFVIRTDNGRLKIALKPIREDIAAIVVE